MYKKVLSVFLAAVLSLSGLSVFADDEITDDSSEEACATGALEMTDEQISNIKNSIPMIVDVKPNRLFYQRLNEENGIDSDSGLAGGGIGSSLADDGDEIVSAIVSDNSQISTNSMVSLMSADDEVSLPTKVDNSTEMTFPVIGDQGNISTCFGWSLAYYQLTNNINKIRGTDARKNSTTNISANVFSPNWVYNLGRDATELGMYAEEAVNVLYTYGCPPTNEVYTGTKKDFSWYPSAAVWEKALYNKCDVYYGSVNPNGEDTPVTNRSSSNLDAIKKLLADGYVVTTETYALYDEEKNCPIVKRGYTGSGAREYVWTEVREAEGAGHAVTIVGYDDNFKVDINGNGSYESGERGAFKIANSWGTSAPNHNKGFVWLAYDALNRKSSVLRSNNTLRVPAFRCNDLYYFVKPKKDYKPLLSAAVGINTNCRNNITVKIGIVDKNNSAKMYEKKLTSGEYHTYNNKNYVLSGKIAFNKGFGSYNLRGTSGYKTDYVTFDFTSLLKEFELEKDHVYNVYIKLIDSSGGTSSIESFALKDYNTGTIYQSENLPVSTGSGQSTAEASVEYVSSIISAKNDKQFKLTFNSELNEDTVDEDSILVRKSDDDCVLINVALDETDKKVTVSRKYGTYDTDFYTMNILTWLKSKGGNSLKENISIPFYVPFH